MMLNFGNCHRNRIWVPPKRELKERGSSTENNWIRRFYNYDDYNDMTGETLRVKEIADDPNSERVFDIDYFRNAYGHVRVKRLPSGRLMPYLNDGLGRPMRVGFANSHLADDIFYHPTGDVSAMDYGNGQAFTQSLNVRTLPFRLTTSLNGGAASVDLQYSYDVNGRIDFQTDHVNTANNRWYQYDDLGRLKQANSNSWGQASYTYDSLGNIRNKTIGPRNIVMTYDGNNRLTRAHDSDSSGNGNGTGNRVLEYDGRGNVTRLGDLRFIYDMANQPRTVYGTNAKGESIGNQYDNYYVYDGNMKRVKSVVNGRTIFNVYDAAGKLVHVEESDDPNTSEMDYAETDYVHANGQTIARIKNGTFTYLHPDHLGSAQAGTKGEGFPMADIGKVDWRENYTPYGETLVNNATNDNQAGFTGHIKDADTGLNYMQARYYDPNIGRFLSIDPVNFLQTGDPAYFNRYSYTANDPINLIDPNGQEFRFAEGSTDEFKEAVAGAFAKISESSEGASTIQTLEKSSHIITLKESTGGNSSDPIDNGSDTLDPNLGNGEGVGSTVLWNPNGTTGGQDAKGNQERPAFVGLGHELGHSFEYATGTTDYITTQSDGSLPQERKSLDVENAVRRQHNLTPRRQYGPNRINVPQRVPNGWIPHKKNRAGD